MISSKLLGLSRLIRSFIPRDSNWNTAVVSALCRSSNVSASCKGIVAISNSTSSFLLRSALIVVSAQSIMVRVLKPKKSNLTSPAASTSSLSYWVTRLAPVSSQYTGQKSVSWVGAITTPPACFPTLRVMPSNLKAISIISPASASFATYSRMACSCSIALVSVIPGSNGIIFESLSAREYGLP